MNVNDINRNRNFCFVHLALYRFHVLKGTDLQVSEQHQLALGILPQMVNGLFNSLASSRLFCAANLCGVDLPLHEVLQGSAYHGLRREAKGSEPREGGKVRLGGASP